MFVQIAQTPGSGHPVHSFQQKRVIFCAPFRPEDHIPGDMTELRMGCGSQARVRLTAGVVPSVHTVDLAWPFFLLLHHVQFVFF